MRQVMTMMLDIMGNVPNADHISTLSLYLGAVSASDADLPCRPEALGPLLQGFLMETIDPSYAAHLHASTFNPYSMYCVSDGDGKVVWRINALKDEAARHLIAPLSVVDTIRLRGIDRTLSVEKRVVETIPIENLLKLLTADEGSRHKIRFLTPTAFKVRGEYVNMPNVRLIFQNLLMHYGQIYSGSNEIDEETLAYISGHSRIVSYNLKSRYFSQSVSGKAKIPAFVGELTVNVSGPVPLRGLADMLLEFGTYAGMGIKTSMGMGGMDKTRDIRLESGR